VKQKSPAQKIKTVVEKAHERAEATTFVREAIIEALKAGDKSQAKIAEECGCSAATVQRIAREERLRPSDGGGVLSLSERWKMLANTTYNAERIVSLRDKFFARAEVLLDDVSDPKEFRDLTHAFATLSELAIPRNPFGPDGTLRVMHEGSINQKVSGGVVHAHLDVEALIADPRARILLDQLAPLAARVEVDASSDGGTPQPGTVAIDSAPEADFQQDS